MSIHDRGTLGDEGEGNSQTSVGATVGQKETSTYPLRIALIVAQKEVGHALSRDRSNESNPKQNGKHCP